MPSKSKRSSRSRSSSKARQTPASGGRGSAGKTDDGQKRPASPIKPKELAEALPETKAAAADAVGGEENLPDPGEAPADVDYLAVDRLWREVTKIKKAFEKVTAELDDKKRELDAAEKAVEEEKSAWAAKREEAEREAAAEEQELRRRRTECDEREKKLAALALELAQQEESAKAGAATAVQDALAEARKQIDDERKQLAQQREENRKKLVAVQELEEDLKDKQQLSEQRIKDEVERRSEQRRLRLEALEQRHRTLLGDHENLERELAEYQRIEREFPDFDPERVLTELHRLEEENARLRADRPKAEIDSELERLRKAEQHWEGDRAYLQAENARLQQKLTAHTITAFELQRLEVVKNALETDKEAYREEVEKLRDDLDGLRVRKGEESPFPECFRMDQKHKDARDDLVDEMPALPEFIELLRNFIAQQDGLFYSDADLRRFLAGLNATRLHLLQGPSGIGKTQLPLVFAKAINAHAAVVPVGADWRTPQDLAGYYNAFERRFYESTFTKAIYQANCPEFAARPFFVVLDEMNLSHPEQYFSGVLSAIEVKEKTNEASMRIELMTTRTQQPPQRLVDGRLLPIPPNLWFVGTANQDETTVGFADKTFDRSNVLELPVRPERFEPPTTDPLPPLSLKALRRRFDEALKNDKFLKDCVTVKKFVDGALRDRMYREFRIDVGPRAMAQVDDFVPVLRAAGGSISEAADHTVATKVLRKIRGHYQFSTSIIEALLDELPTIWERLPGSETPVRSIELLEDEIRMRGGV